jgi:hypothetical protein
MIEKSYVGLEVMLRCNEPMERWLQRDLGLTSTAMLFTQRAQDGEECCAIVLGKQEYLDDRGPRINDHMVEA